MIARAKMTKETLMFMKEIPIAIRAKKTGTRVRTVDPTISR